ncbi:MAG: response regulator [Acidobacteriota bacterium]
MPQILVVDDEKEILDILTRFFTKKSYSVVTAETGEECLDILEKEKVDAVLLDIHLPGMSGLETLRRIHSTRPDLPVVMISAQDDEEVAKATLEEGAFDYVVKPLNFDYLERTVYLKLVQTLP